MSSNNPNRVYLDTETTGLHPEEGDEILSLTIVDANGRLLFDERFKPKHKKEWPEELDERPAWLASRHPRLPCRTEMRRRP